MWWRRRQIKGEHGGEGTTLALLRGFFPGLIVVVLSFSCKTVANGGGTGVIF